MNHRIAPQPQPDGSSATLLPARDSDGSIRVRELAAVLDDPAEAVPDPTPVYGLQLGPGPRRVLVLRTALRGRLAGQNGAGEPLTALSLVWAPFSRDGMPLDIAPASVGQLRAWLAACAPDGRLVGQFEDDPRHCAMVAVDREPVGRNDLALVIITVPGF